MEQVSLPELIVRDLPTKLMKTKPKDEDLSFGASFSDRMLVREFKDGKWQTGEIKPFENFSMSPASLVFHYGQAIFEGMKAYKQVSGDIVLFRPDMNAERFHKSAIRMVMEPVDPTYFVESIKALVRLEKDWVPSLKGTALYIRPTLIASEAILGVRPSAEYIYYTILAPSSPYFKEGFAPTKIFVENEFVRAVKGGVGETKTAGNYASSLYGAKQAKALGYSQVLWLDAVQRKYVEEVGAMNIAFVVDGEIYTPPLSGSILPGVTRDSILKLAPTLGYKIHEKAMAIDELTEGIKSGGVSEIFGMGTAAIIAPVGEIKYKDEILKINNNEIGDITRNLYEGLLGIQTGVKEDEFGWIINVDD